MSKYTELKDAVVSALYGAVLCSGIVTFIIIALTVIWNMILSYVISITNYFNSLGYAGYGYTLVVVFVFYFCALFYIDFLKYKLQDTEA